MQARVMGVPLSKQFLYAIVAIAILSVCIGGVWVATVDQAANIGEWVSRKIVWFECGLLWKYSLDDFVSVLEHFNFDCVMIQPFVRDEQGGQTVIHNLTDMLLDTIPDNVQVFLFVGSYSYLDRTLVGRYSNQNYVLCIDDGITDIDILRTNLAYIKDAGAETGLAHWQMNEVYPTLMSEGLIDYSITCFYPYHPGKNLTQFEADFKMMREWCGEDVSFVPNIQAFGGTLVQWRFPNATEVEYMTRFLSDLKPWGIVWFLPWSGLSLRGEDFEGFLEHPEIWQFID